MSDDYVIADRVDEIKTITFAEDGKELGKLIMEDPMRFEGNAEESAQVFFDYVVKLNNKRIAELEGDLKWSEELADRRLQDVRNRDKRIAELEAENRLNYLNSVAGQKKVIELEAQLDAVRDENKRLIKVFSRPTPEDYEE